MWLNPDEARAFLGVTQRTLNKMVKDGRLTQRQLSDGRYRYKASDIRAITMPKRDTRPENRVVVEGIAHGLYGYSRFGCRCAVCRKARSDYVREYRTSDRTDLPPGDPRHGKRSTYIMRGCKCELCMEAVRAYARGRQDAIRREREWAGL